MLSTFVFVSQCAFCVFQCSGGGAGAGCERVPAKLGGGGVQRGGGGGGDEGAHPHHHRHGQGLLANLRLRLQLLHH